MTQKGRSSFGLIRERLGRLASGNLAALTANQCLTALANVAILFMINRVYAREGETTDAGRLALVIAIIHGVLLVSASGVARSVTIRISRARAERGREAVENIARSIGGGLVLTLVFSALLVVLGLALPEAVLAAARRWWPGQADLVGVYVRPLQVGALWLPGGCLIIVTVAVFDGFQRMRWSLAAEAGTFQMLRLAAAVLVILVFVWPWTMMALAWAVAYTLAAGLVAVQLALFLRRRRQPVRWRALPLREMAGDAWLMFLPMIAPLLVTHTGVLVAWAGGGDEASAAFWVTWAMAIAMSELSRPVGRLLLPAVPNLRRMPDRHEMARVLRLAFWGVGGVTFLFFVGLTVAKGWLLAYLHQESHRIVLTVFMTAGFFEVYRTVFNPVLLATGRKKAIATLEWLGLGAIVVIGVLAMAAFGLVGLAVVFLMVYLVSAALRVKMIASATGVRLWLDASVMAAVVLGAGAVIGALETGLL